MRHWVYGNHVYFFFPPSNDWINVQSFYRRAGHSRSCQASGHHAHWSWGTLIGWYFSKPRPSRPVKRRLATAALFWFCLRLRGSERAHWWRGELRRVTSIRNLNLWCRTVFFDFVRGFFFFLTSVTGYIYARRLSLILEINCGRKGHNYRLVWYINYKSGRIFVADLVFSKRNRMQRGKHTMQQKKTALLKW